MKMFAGEIIRHSTRDFPGKESAVLYLVGCNFRCPFCAYSRFISGDGLDVTYTEDQVFQRLEKWRPQLAGVVFSGGEPTLHSDLRAWITRARALGYAVKLDTNGSQPEVIRGFLVDGLLDYIAMDVKAPAENYSQACGSRVDAEIIKTSIWLIKHSGVPHEFRTTVVPGLHTVRELKSIAEWVHGADNYVVQDFISEHALRSDLRDRNAFPHRPLEEIRTFVERRVRSYEIRHSEEAKVMPYFGRRRSPSKLAKTG